MASLPRRPAAAARAGRAIQVAVNHFRVRVKGSTERGGAFHVTVRFASVKRVAQLDELFAGHLDVTPYDVLQALDVVMRHTAALRLELVGRTLVNPLSGNRQSLGGGVSCVAGYYQSLRPTQSRLTLNEVLGSQGALRPPLTHAQTKTLTDTLKNVRVDVTHQQGANGGRLGYRINPVTGLSAEQQTFGNENGREQTVAAFFAAHYTSLQFPKLPCVHVGAVNRKVYLPLEVCFVSGKQRVRAKISGRQTSSMIRFVCVAPQERKRVIETALREDARFREDPRLPAYGLSVEQGMLRDNSTRTTSTRCGYQSWYHDGSCKR